MLDTNAAARRFAVIAAVSAVMFLAGSTPALADQGDIDSTCGSGRVCMWENTNFGSRKWVDQSAPDGKVYDIDWWNGDNEISSIRNTSGNYICVYPGDYPWGGGHIIVGPHQELPNLAQSNGFDNNAESFRVSDDPVHECN